MANGQRSVVFDDLFSYGFEYMSCAWAIDESDSMSVSHRWPVYCSSHEQVKFFSGNLKWQVPLNRHGLEKHGSVLQEGSRRYTLAAQQLLKHWMSVTHRYDCCSCPSVIHNTRLYKMIYKYIVHQWVPRSTSNSFFFLPTIVATY